MFNNSFCDCEIFCFFYVYKKNQSATVFSFFSSVLCGCVMLSSAMKTFGVKYELIYFASVTKHLPSDANNFIFVDKMAAHMTLIIWKFFGEKLEETCVY